MKRPNGYWNIKENVFAEARKYQTKSEFKNGCSGAYISARKKGWLLEMDWFIDGRVKLLTDKNDSVYKYYFKETNSIYIGRTLIRRQKIRHNDHSTSEKDTVFRHAKENSLTVPPMEIIENNLTIKEGLEREDYWVNYYKEKGYNVLNVGKTGVESGAIGAISYGKWTKERVFEEGKKYKTRKEFYKGCGSAYEVARKNGWLDEMDWFEKIRKSRGYWQNKDNVFEEARKYSTRGEFYKGCSSAYDVANNNGWLSEMTWFVNGHVKWTKEKIVEESRKYPTRTQFSKHNSSAYEVARKNGWLDELFPKKYIA